MKALLTERVQKGYPDEPLLAATQSQGVIRKSDYATRTVTVTKDLHLLKLVEIGDFVISLRSFQGGIERCFHRGIISPAYTVLTARSDSYRDYLTYLFKSKPFVSSLTLSVTGIREGQNIDYSKLSMEMLPVPPHEDRKAIVKYLAHANARIDKVIASKRQLIALLEERYLGGREEFVIGQGCDVQVSTQNPWIPYAPGHWKVMRLKQVLKGIEQGWSPQCDTQPASLDEWGVTKAGCSNYGQFRSEENKRLSDGLEARPWLEIQHGDLLVSRANTRELVGSAAVALNPRMKLMFSDKTFRLKVRKSQVDPEFLVLAMSVRSARGQIEAGAVGASHSMQNISQGVIADLWIALPPIDEQVKIVTQVRQLYAATTHVIEKSLREIELLQEFRTRLVADVVTGQVDVRAIAATLPDTPESSLDLTGDSDDVLEGIMEDQSE
ncbi:MAG: restriction endonuclease subunit S [Ancrocorticia sp.]